MAGRIHDYTIRGIFSADIVRIMTALETSAHMLRLTSDDVSPEYEWERLEAAHLDRIRGAVSMAKVLA